MTIAQFLAWEDQQELRYEFDGVAPRAMTGGTAAHAAIQRNLLYALTGRFRGKPCQLYGSELKVQTADGIRYPDAFVICTPVALQAKVVFGPVVMFEVVSPSSMTVDFVDKNAECRAMPSVRRYVVLHQARAAATVFSRKGEDWVTDLVRGDDGVLGMPEIELEIPLAEIYLDLELTPEPVRAGDPA